MGGVVFALIITLVYKVCLPDSCSLSLICTTHRSESAESAGVSHVAFRVRGRWLDRWSYCLVLLQLGGTSYGLATCLSVGGPSQAYTFTQMEEDRSYFVCKVQSP